MDETQAVVKILKKYRVEQGEQIAPRDYSLPVPLAKAHKYAASVLKKKRPVITAVLISEGGTTKIEEMKSVEDAEAKGAQTAVTTTVPNRGCPAPVYDPMLARDIRATRLLLRFLNRTQRRDFVREASVMAIGGATGHPYRINHRHSRRAAQEGIVVDAHRRIPICTLETDLPASEEMLSILVVLSVPRTEMDWVNGHV